MFSKLRFWHINREARASSCKLTRMYKVSVKQSKQNYIWYLQLTVVGSYQQPHVSVIMVAIISLYILK